MQAQAQAVGRRQRLGDAAEIEHLQAAMALEQAQAQAAAALARAAAAREFLGRRYPGLLAPAGDKPAVVPTAPDPASAGALPALEAWPFRRHDHEDCSGSVLDRADALSREAGHPNDPGATADA